MKVLILAGGLGTRLSEETALKPKPMVEIGSHPILWHIMKIYAHFGHHEFIILCGYKGNVIKDFFVNYSLMRADLEVDLANHKTTLLSNQAEPWKVTLIDTGQETMTGGRIRRVKDLIGGEPFLLTYGDGVANININELIAFHRQQKSLVTLSAIQPPGRFGAFTLKEESAFISNFKEKPNGDGHETAWVNGGFFVVEPQAIDFIEGDQTSWEKEPLETIASLGKLSAYRHKGFWHPMDTLRDKRTLEDLWEQKTAPWKVWD